MKTREDKQRGSALLELSILSPLLLYLSLSATNLTFWIIGHNRLNSIAYDLARYGAEIEDLEPCTGSASCRLLENHNKIYQRALTLVTRNGYETDRIAVNTEYFNDAPANSNNASNQAVIVELIVPFEPFLNSSMFYLPTNQIRARAAAPYLKIGSS